MDNCKVIFFLLALLSLVAFPGVVIAGGQGAISEKSLGIGRVQVRDFGTIKVHSYETKDPLGDECFLLETASTLVAIESPAVEGNIAEWKDYIGSLRKPLTDILIAYHPTGGDWYGDATGHASAGAKQAIDGGTTRNLAQTLGKSFGSGFNANIAVIDSVMPAGINTIGGIELEIIEDGDGYEVYIPSIKVLYTHMLGADSHSILAGQDHITAVLASLKDMKARKCWLILSAHHTPETLADVDTKIAYVEKVKAIAARSADKDDFVARVKKAYPNSAGLNYLDMTAGYFFMKAVGD
jgi:hypothetical protein